MGVVLGPFSFNRVVSAVEDVHQRLLRATAALGAAKIPYAVVDDNAVALWVSRVDKAAVRNTQDVDILVRRTDLEACKSALSPAGFVYRNTGGMDIFLDGPGAKARDAVHIIFANEKVRPQESLPNPDASDADATGTYSVLALEPLVKIKLTAFRDKDRVHLRDMIDVGLIDDGWMPKLPADLAARLKSLLDTPGG